MRDTYETGDKLVIVTTDRQSAFDRILASIPFKVLLCPSATLNSIKHKAEAVKPPVSTLGVLLLLLGIKKPSAFARHEETRGRS